MASFIRFYQTGLQIISAVCNKKTSRLTAWLVTGSIITNLLIATPVLAAASIIFNVATAGSNVDSISPGTIPNVTISNLTRGPGLTHESYFDGYSGNFHGSKDWTTSATRDADDYMQFTITPGAGYAVTYTFLSYSLLIQDAVNSDYRGPQKWELRYSTDGFTSVDYLLATHDVSANYTGSAQLKQLPFTDNLSAIGTQAGPVSFRLYGYNTMGSSSGSFAGVSNSTNGPTGGGFSWSGTGGNIILDAAASALLTTTTSVTSAPNASILGQLVTFTATVTSTVGSPTGSVQFYADGATLGSPVSLSSGKAVTSTASLTVGTHPITATYSGDATYAASTSSVYTQTVNGTPNLQITKTHNAATVNAGDAIAYDITVTNTGTATATGISVTDNLPNKPGLSWTITSMSPYYISGYCQLNLIAPQTLTCSFDQLAPNQSVTVRVSSPTITATCGTVSNTASVNASNHGQATTPQANITVNCSTTTTVTSAPNPSTFGQSVTFTATVSPPPSGGTVQFYADGATLGSPVTLSSGQAMTSTASLTLGTHPITATYSGDGNYIGSTSSTYAQTVLPPILYAKPGGLTSGYCESWTTACELRYATTSAISGQEVWVAAGTYKPTNGTDRDATFQLKNGVAIYGGFAMTETLRTQRNPAANVVVLSGDLTGDDSGFTNNGENSYHVVMGASGATLDGVTISGGNANGSNPYDRGGGMLNNIVSPTLNSIIFSGNWATVGGGMYNDASSPMLSSNTFISNSASYSGGGMQNYTNSTPTLSNVTFISNTAQYGGGMFNHSSSPTLTNVTFSGNSASTQYGGGMHNESSSNPALTNVTFNGNSAAVYGGGMYNISSNPTLTNVTFRGNSGGQWGGGMLNWASSPVLTNVTFNGNSGGPWNMYGGGGMANYSNSNPQVRNSILWGNSGLNGSQIFNAPGSMPTLTYSVVQGGCPSGSTCTNLITANPLLRSLGNYGGSTQTIPLLPGSSAINAGNATYCTIGSDQRGVSYIGTCDIGAFESQGFTLTKSNGDNQSTPINTSFTQPLSMTVTSAYGEPVNNGQVILTAPISGASITGTTPIALTITASGTVSRSMAANNIPGSYNLTASASGATSVDFALTNLPGNTTTNVASSPNPSVYNQIVTFTATVSSLSGIPNGTVNFFDNGSSMGSGDLNASGYATITISTLSAGTHPTITATYVGNTNYNGSTSSNYLHTVNKASATIALGNLSQTYDGASKPVTSTTTPIGLTVVVTYTGTGSTVYGPSTTAPTNAGTYSVAATINDANYQGAATDTLTIAKASATIALGNLTQTYDGTSKPVTSTTSPLGLTVVVTYTGSGGAVYGPSTTAPTNAGTYAVVATVNDANYLGNANNTLTINKANSTTSLTASVNPSILGQSVTFTAQVTSTPPITPTGTVTFTIDANAPFAQALVNGSTSFSSSSLVVGTHIITATYGGETNYTGSTKSGGQNVQYALPTITSMNPTSAPINAPTFTLVVTGTGFANGASVIRWNDVDHTTSFVNSTQLTTTIQKSELVTAGNVTVTVFNPTPGGGQATPPLTFTIGQGDTQLTLTSSGSPSVWTQPVTLTASLTQTFGAHRPRDIAPSGTVSFTDSTTGQTVCGGVTMTNWQALCNTTTLTVGAHMLVATFSGNANYVNSPSNTLPHIVSKATTTITLTSSLSPAVVGQSVTFTATVGASALAKPSTKSLSNGTCVFGGTVQFKDGATNLGSTQSLDATCRATLTTNQLAVGAHAITAIYSGDGNYTGATSSPINQILNNAKLYLPQMLRSFADAPNLVVESLNVSATDIQVVIKNIGTQPVVDEFWVDVYINPTTVPTHVNQTWAMVGTQGLVWGVTSAGLPIQPGETRTLNIVNDPNHYYWPSLSHFTLPLTNATVYVQVDSANANTNYGAVRENHEIAGNAYDNIRKFTVTNGIVSLPTNSLRDPSTRSVLPARPQ